MPEATGIQAGKVVALAGEVSAESSQGSRILSVDSPVFQDDVLVTEQGERVEVLFTDGTRLSQGENSRLNLDTFAFDPADPGASSILLNAVQGTFRTITGKIADQNPENFTIKTPLATLGIRGTTVLSHITPDHEMHGPEYIEEGKALVLVDNFGNIRFITDHVPIKVIDVWPDEPAGFQRILTAEEFLFFEQQVPMSAPEGDETTTTGIPAPAGPESGDGQTPFGPDSDESTSLANQANAPPLFGPEGLPFFGVDGGAQPMEPVFQAAGAVVPAGGTSSLQPPAGDVLFGYIEDSSHTNNPPIARSIFASTDEDHTLHGTLQASDPDGDPLAFSVLSSPGNGSVTINADGSFAYHPNANFFGTDSFSYQVTDPYGASSSAMVSIEVNPVNDAPVAQDEVFHTGQDQPFSGHLFGYDVDGDQLFFSLSTDPLHGTITINPDGSFTYTPDPGFTGTDTFQFLLQDGHGGFDIGQGVFVVATGPVPPVNDPPLASDQTFTAAQGSTLNGQLLATDPQGDPLTYAELTPPSFGSLTVNPDGSFSYSTTSNPLEENYGTDTFQYTADDGQGNQDTGLVSITVSANYTGDNAANAPKAGTSLADNFNGMGGNDTINGAGGADSITGGPGNDTLTGGSGNDTFIYSNVNEGVDTITDFTSGADVLRIGGTGVGTSVVTSAGPGGYGGTTTGSPGAAIVLHHNTSLNTWQVIYDPSVAFVVTYTLSSPSETLIVNLGSHTITTGDVVLA